MHNVIKIFFNIILVTLFLFSTIIIISESTSIFNKKISRSIEENFLDNYNITANIDSIKIKWEGIDPNIYISNLKVNDKQNKLVLDTPICVLKINLLKSLHQMSVKVSEIVIDNTSIDLTREGSKIFINNLNLTDQTNRTGDISLPRIVLKNSKVKLNDKTINNSFTYEVNTLEVSYLQNALNVYANFFHKSSPEPIKFIYRGSIDENKNLGKAYISGNSVSLPYELLPASLNKIRSDRISFRIWLDLDNMKLEKIVGNIAARKLTIRLPHTNLEIENANSDILYTKNKTTESLALTRLNYQMDNIKVNDNKIVISKNRFKGLKLFIKKSNNQIIDILSKRIDLFNSNYLSKLKTSSINNFQIHISNKDILDYFELTVDSPLLEYNKQYQLNNISLNVYGNLKRGRMHILNLSMDNNDMNLIDNMNGVISYDVKGKSIYFSSTNLEDENGHKLSISGKKISKYPVLKVELSSSIKEIANKIYPEIEKDISELSGRLNSKIYYYKDKIFARTKISKFYLKNSDSIYFSTDQIDLYHSSNMIKSNKFFFNINNHNQTSTIDTNINSKTYVYVMTTLGEVDTTLLSNLLNMNNNIVSGKTFIKSKISINKKSREIRLFASSDLKGVSIDIYKSSIKKPREKLDATLNYQYSKSVSYPIKLSIDKHSLEIKNEINHLYLKVKSPAARGFIKYPKLFEKDESVNGSFEYIDTNFFAGSSFFTSLPKMNIKSKHLKSNDLVFDNFHIIMTPMNEYIEITKLDFKNMHLEMASSGKWFINENVRTELLAKIKSDNFGLALETLGYPSTIKGGNLEAELSGMWEGSVQEFGFSKTNGSLIFNIEKGQISELDKGTQAIGQVLGLFSISTIPKRLSLDFSDFFSTGLSFDNLNTEIALNSGIADTKKMIINGSFGEMRLSGESDLINQTHDQVLIFIPDLSSTSLVTGAVIGGPIGAVASIFYDKLLKEFGLDTNKLAGIEYSIKGPWKDPKIKVTQAFKPILN